MSLTLKEMKTEIFDEKWTPEEMQSKMNIIHNMDCLEFMKRVPDNYFDLCVTDSPYKLISGGSTSLGDGGFIKGVSQDQHKSGKLFNHNDISFSDWLPDLFRILKRGTHFYSMVNDRNISEMITEAENVGFEFVNMLVWDKGNVVMNRYYMKQTEFICLFRKGEARTINDAGTSNLIKIPNEVGSKLHPSQKPQKLKEVFIKNSSNKGEKVFDPFMGSGTTALACKSLGDLHWCGCELESDYVEIANKRLEQVQGSLF